MRIRHKMKNAALAALLLGTAAGGANQAFAQSASENQAALIEKGRMVATGADCMACHTVPKTGKPFAGGYGIVSPLGTIFSTNITPSKTAGIGNYSEADFSRAVRLGIRKDGAHLYPAMPYSAYAEMTDDDIRALYTYFMNSVEPVDTAPKQETALPFPFNIRLSMAGWNLLYATKHPYVEDTTKSAEINRGAYIAGALGHCSSCHTPRGLLMGEDGGAFLGGGFVGPWYAPNITSDPVSGIGGWSDDELVQYFRTGHADGKNQAAGGMAEAIQNSLQYLPESDLRSLAKYLKTVPTIRDQADAQPAHAFGSAHSDEANIRGVYRPNEHNSLRNGEELYSGYCASCHQPDGAGSENQAYPSLFHNTATGAGKPANLVAAILNGVERTTGEHEVLMPSFGPGSYVTPLSDKEIADISNYVLKRFGNPEAHVTMEDVAIARSGGPVPLLAKMQPYILPAIAAAAFVVVLAGGILVSVLRRRHKTSVAIG